MLADQASLDGLEAPMLVASLGFPLEGIGQGIVNPNSPTPTVQVAPDRRHRLLRQGDLAGVRSFARPACRRHARLQRQPDPERARRSDCHSSSGIPIGKTDQGDVICTPANIFFAHRVDLARELSDPARAELQTRRAKSWAETIQNFPCRKEYQ